VSDHESGTPSLDPQWLPSHIDTSVAHPARRYNYWLGGKYNFPADREAGDAVTAGYPAIRIAALENRAFLRRAVTVLAEEAGVRQFLDIGAGLPAADNTHEVARRVAPESRVVYIDNDPLVAVTADALLTGGSDLGVTDYVEADVRTPDAILAAATGTLDFGQPIALMLLAVLHFISDRDDPHGIVAQLVGALAPGSYLVLSHAGSDLIPEDHLTLIAEGRFGPFWPRSREQIAHFFDGLECCHQESRRWRTGAPTTNPSHGRRPPRPRLTARSPGSPDPATDHVRAQVYPSWMVTGRRRISGT